MIVLDLKKITLLPLLDIVLICYDKVDKNALYNRGS